MTSHQAPAQMLGYIYQIRCALYLLLSAENEQSSISIEHFDDIVFSNDGDTPDILIQTKHHVAKHGDLSDSSTDMWRTLKVWIDMQNTKADVLTDTKCMIITTSTAPNGSAAELLRHGDNRDCDQAYQIFKNVAENSKNKSHSKYYKAFLNLTEKDALDLFRRVFVLDNNYNIESIEHAIRKEIRYSSLPQYEDRFLERFEGWWFRESINALRSIDPVFISQGQVRTKICSLSAEYTSDNLPIDVDGLADVDIESLPNNERIFCKQLELIAVGKRQLQVAVRDYYRAFSQRTNWVKDDLLYIDELERYEKRLADEWDHLFAAMQDDAESQNSIGEKDKQTLGKALFRKIDDKDIRIREKCSEPFVMRGSYHMLANRLAIGWHLDFVERLKHLIEI